MIFDSSLDKDPGRPFSWSVADGRGGGRWREQMAPWEEASPPPPPPRPPPEARRPAPSIRGRTDRS